MHKSDIEACFSHWLAQQEKGKQVVFAFSHVLGLDQHFKKQFGSMNFWT
jgi:hypothetical protein